MPEVDPSRAERDWLAGAVAVLSRGRRALGWGRAVLLSALWAATAVADERAAAPDGECPSPPALGATSSEQQVAQLYRQFECRFMLEEYGACLPYLERACSLKPSPRCAFNLAAVHHALMHCELARAYYLEYLDAVPYEPDAEAARRALEELAGTCGQAPVAAAPAERRSGAETRPQAEAPGEQGAPVIPPLWSSAGPDVPPALARVTPVRADGAVEHHSRRTLAWWLLGTGAASGAAAVVALVHGARAEHDAEQRDRDNGGLVITGDPELRAIDRRGRRDNQLGAVLGVSSGVLLGAGVTLWVLNPGDGASIRVSPDGSATMSYRAAF